MGERTTIKPGDDDLNYLLYDAKADPNATLLWETGDGVRRLQPQETLLPDTS
jgi:hypothetical protein